MLHLKAVDFSWKKFCYLRIPIMIYKFPGSKFQLFELYHMHTVQIRSENDTLLLHILCCLVLKTMSMVRLTQSTIYKKKYHVIQPLLFWQIFLNQTDHALTLVAL